MKARLNYAALLVFVLAFMPILWISVYTGSGGVKDLFYSCSQSRNLMERIKNIRKEGGWTSN